MTNLSKKTLAKLDYYRKATIILTIVGIPEPELKVGGDRTVMLDMSADCIEVTKKEDGRIVIRSDYA